MRKFLHAVTIIFILVAVLFTGFWYYTGTAEAARSPFCPLSSQANRVLVDFSPKTGIRSDQSQSDATAGPFPVSLPSGTYAVTLVSYDNHSEKNQSQPQESWYLVLKNSAGDLVTTTNAISDLPENNDYWIETVQNTLSVSATVSTVTAYHAAYPDSDPNSVIPVCAAFDAQNLSPQPFVDIKANGSDGPITIAYNSSATISWTSENATSCSVSPTGWTGVSGSQSSGAQTDMRTYTVNCTGPGGSASDSVTVQVAQQANADIKANGSDGPITVPYNTSVAITWNSVNVSSCFVSPSGWTGTSGSQTTGNLTASQTYTLQCSGQFGSPSDSVTINVNPAPQPFVDIKANGSDGPITIAYNSSATISWTSENATSCSVSPTGWSGISGSVSSGFLTSPQTYTINCEGNGGNASDSVTVFVEPQAPPVVDIKADGSDGPVSVPYSSAATVSWTSQNANSCTVYPDGWIGASGSQTTGILTGSRTYTAICTGPGGSASDSVTVTVNSIPQDAPTVDIKADGFDVSLTIPYNTSATISWTSANADTCSVLPHGWSGTSGSQNTGNLTGSRTYTAHCTGPGGSATDSVTVFVNQLQQPSVTLTANPTHITKGQTSFLNWVSSHADTCLASNGWSGRKSVTGSEYVTPGVTTTYRITCSNAYGVASDTDTVYVDTAPSATNLQVTKRARNITLNQNSFSDFIEAQGLDILEFEIRVRNIDVSSGSVTVRDILPPELLYVNGSTAVNGAPVADGIAADGYVLGTIQPNEERTLTFRATVFVGAEQKLLVNQATATMNSGVQTGYANVQIKNRGQVLGAGDIITGPEDAMLLLLVLGFITSLFVYYIVFFRVRHESLLNFKAAFAKGRFERKVRELRKREKKPDTYAG